MRDKQSKRLFRAAICIILSVFGLFYTFGAGTGGDAQKEETISKDSRNAYGYDEYHQQRQLPGNENESQDETYTDGKNIKAYFTNTEKLDNSTLPLAAHAILCQEMQKYLDAGGFENVTELRILDNGFSDNEDSITFRCRIAGYGETLEVSYKKEEKKLKFQTVETERIKK